MSTVATLNTDLFAENAAYPVRSGNFVRPLIDGHAAFSRICEAVEAATHSVWITVAFIHDDFELPGGRGSFLAYLERARQRGLDVRVLFWRNNEGSGFNNAHMFSGDAAHRATLKASNCNVLIRWDRAERNYCQHQKSWLIDAGRPSEIAFVGGINLNSECVVAAGHDHGDHRHTHDIYLELHGPCATDVHHNFVQRWNEASERDAPDGVWPDLDSASVLAFPSLVSPPRGDAMAQVQRTVRANRYHASTPTPLGKPFEISKGERSCFEQYERAIAAAKSHIYIENQALGQPETVEALHAALGRGVLVSVLVPADPNEFMSQARKDPRLKPFFDRLGALGDHDHFLLAGIARRTARGNFENIYVHTKAAMIDDHWATVGSCNIGARSFFGDTELNVSFVSPKAVQAFRAELMREHTGLDWQSLTGLDSSRRFQQHARDNATRRREGGAMQGLCFALDPKTYGA